MRLFGLIGHPLGHSFSKRYFTEKFSHEGVSDAAYELFDLEDVSQIPAVLSKPGLHGLNVTTPYKVDIMDYLDDLDPAAREIGAVNCIRLRQQGGAVQSLGFNTDALAFEQSLLPMLKEHHHRALVLGSGGASKAVAYALTRLKINFTIISRNPMRPGQSSYDALRKDGLEPYPLIINTTPLGMYPAVDVAPDLPYHTLTAFHLLYDLVYNPQKTQFMKKGTSCGATVKNGMEMLTLQAELSWELWNS